MSSTNPIIMTNVTSGIDSASEYYKTKFQSKNIFKTLKTRLICQLLFCINKINKLIYKILYDTKT